MIREASIDDLITFNQLIDAIYDTRTIEEIEYLINFHIEPYVLCHKITRNEKGSYRIEQSERLLLRSIADFRPFFIEEKAISSFNEESDTEELKRFRNYQVDEYIVKTGLTLKSAHPFFNSLGIGEVIKRNTSFMNLAEKEDNIFFFKKENML